MIGKGKGLREKGREKVKQLGQCLRQGCATQKRLAKVNKSRVAWTVFPSKEQSRVILRKGEKTENETLRLRFRYFANFPHPGMSVNVKLPEVAGKLSLRIVLPDVRHAQFTLEAVYINRLHVKFQTRNSLSPLFPSGHGKGLR